MIKAVSSIIIAIMLGAHAAFAFEPGDIKTTDLICSEQDVTVTIAKAIDEDFFLDKQDRAIDLIMAAVQEQLCGWAKGDATRYQFKLVKPVWLGDHVEVWEVEAVDNPDVPHAYVGFRRQGAGA